MPARPVPVDVTGQAQEKPGICTPRRAPVLFGGETPGDICPRPQGPRVRGGTGCCGTRCKQHIMAR